MAQLQNEMENFDNFKFCFYMFLFLKNIYFVFGNYHWSKPHWSKPNFSFGDQGTDNSAADAASAKGLSMTQSMATVLAAYFTFMRRFHIFSVVSHIPGHVNDLADSLSRFKQPLPVELSNAHKCEIHWQSVPDTASIQIAQSGPGRKWPKHFPVQSVARSA